MIYLFVVAFLQEARGLLERLVSGALEERTGPQERWGLLALQQKHAVQESEGSRVYVAPLDPSDPQVTSPLSPPPPSFPMFSEDTTLSSVPEGGWFKG